MLTQARLKAILHYNPDTGVFTWLIENWASLRPIGPSGFRGVTIKTRLNRPYVAQIQLADKKVHLGCFATGEEAHAAYCLAAAKYLPRLRGTVAGSATQAGYWRIKIDYTEYLAHHLACLYMTGELPKGQFDHHDRDTANNRWNNLRPATPSQNGANRMGSSATGLKGAYFTNRKLAKPYLASIMVHGKRIHLGYFETPEEAHAAYVIAAKHHFGEFARAS